ncbi:MAG: serine/threonine-protein kinase [Terracidiphilus sp.]|jgi:serine/threonine-protein kinase
MESARWEQIQAVFHAVADLPEPDRHAAVQSACGEDSGLAAGVLALLEEDAQGGSLFDRDLGDLAQQTLDTRYAANHLDNFGPYQPRGLIGEGGMGVVYLAQRRDLGSLVAIKVLRDAWLSPARRERFESEQRTLAQLNHPNIALLFDAGILDDGTPWFVMEYVKGVPPTEYCRIHKSSIQERLRLFRAVCEAVQYAHSQAIIHRDLKPSNILVREDGTVKLLDFGIAKQLENVEERADTTQTALRFMTPAYAAPEQIQSGRPDTRSDVYSLGVILYELLVGQLPFDLSKRTPAETAAAIAHHDPEKPSAVAAKQEATLRAGKAGWSDLDVLCLTAMHRDVERRYQSVEALIRDIDHYLKGEPLEARPDSILYSTGKFITRNWRAVSATLIVFAVIVAQLIFFTVRLANARNAALMQAARTQRIQQFMLNLFGGGDKEAGPAQDLRVVTLIDRGAQEAQTLDKEPEVQAELYLTLGSMYENLGKFDRADSLLESARKIRGSITGPDSVETAESLVALSLLRADQGQYQEAERMARQALAIEDRRLARDSPVRAKAEAALGNVLENDGKYDEAIQVLDESVRVQSGPTGNPTDLTDSLGALADAHGYLGHYSIADSLDRRALDIDRQIYGPVHPHLADALSDLGGFQEILGNYDESERYFRQALEIVQSWYGSDHPATAWQMSRLAQTLQNEGKYEEEARLLQQALPIEERAYGTVHPKVAVVLGLLVDEEERQGKLDKAESDLIRMLSIERTVYGEKHPSVTTVMANLANLYLEKKQYVRAEKLYREVVQRFTDEFSAEHVNTGIVQIKLGLVLLKERRYQDAVAHSSAGYSILSKQTSPAMKFRRLACEDLVTEYKALHQPEQAKQFQAELTAAHQ